MRVLLDTNAYFGDWYLESTAFRVFLDRLPRMDGLMIVPEIVFDEVVNKFGEEIRTLDQIGAKYDAKYNDLLGEKEWDLSTSDVDGSVARYRKQLPTLFPLQQYWRLTPYPSRPHSEVVRRALQRRRPFNDDGGDGYRDTILWETILDVLRESPGPIHFVTNDKRAFGTPPALHPHLRDDLHQLGLPRDCVRLFGSLDELNEALVLPDLPRRLDLVEPLRSGTLDGFSLTKWASSSLPRLLGRLGMEHLVPIRTGSVSADFWPAHPRNIEVASIDDVLQLSSGNLLVSATITAEFHVPIRAMPAQLALPDVQELFGDLMIRGDNVASIGMPIDVHPRIAVTVVLELDTNKPLAATIDEVSHPNITFAFHPHPTNAKS